MDFALRMIAAGLALGLCALGAAAAPHAPEPELVSVACIWNQAPYNAFTDLARFNDRWFCTFRIGEHHVYGEDGRIQIIASDDGAAWEGTAVLAEEGIDLRDPKLSVMPDGRLMMLAGGSVYEGKKYITRQPRVAFSEDGVHWTPTQRILGDGEWLWRVTWHKGVGYGVTRHLSFVDGKKRTVVRLVKTTDGLHYDEITGWGELHNRPNETTVRFLEHDEMMALVRREEGDCHGYIGTSKPPYTAWTWFETQYRLGGPNFIQAPDGSLWAGTRSYGKQTRTILARMGRDFFEPALELPSGGDTSYPGMVWHDGLLWFSYYASHEGKASIYLAKIRLPLDDGA